MLGSLRCRPSAAGRTKAAALAAERGKLLGVTILAAHPPKTVLEAAALQIRLELFLHVSRQRSAGSLARDDERRVVLLDEMIEQRLPGPAR